MKKNFFKPLLLFSALLLSFTISAQQGTIRGTTIEDATGEPLGFVTVAVAEVSGVGTTTDWDGTFSLDLDPGTYSLVLSFISFQDVTITDIEVKAGEVAIFDNIRMYEEATALEEVVVTATQVRNTETALMTIQKKSPNLINGISSQTFRKIGDSNAAGAVKRVTGVSVEGGKYVYVRGLGDRYTKTMLNNMDIPGLDPDRNSLQIDIFPTNLIDNILVYKSSLAEMPADYTGGIVNLVTKDLPDEKIFDISFGIDFNPRMHFNDDYLTYAGSDTDWLGFDNGARALPSRATLDLETIPSPISGDGDQVTGDFLRSFSPELEALPQTSFMDYSASISLANRISLKNAKKSLGYIFTLTYKNTTSFMDDVQYGEYQNRFQDDLYDLDYATVQNGKIGTSNALLGGLLGLAYKTDNAKYRLTAMHLQNGESKAAQINIDNSETAVGQSGYFGFSNNLEWSERSLTNVLLNGRHFSKNGNWELDWRVSPTISRMDEPDIRRTAFTTEQGDPEFNAGAAGFPSRIWRNLEETNLSGRIDLKKDLVINGADAKFKIGVSQVMKDRDYSILTYGVQFFGRQPEWGPNVTANDVWTNENLFPAGTLYLASGNSDPNPNEYKSNSSNTAGYVALEFEPLSKLKAVLGLRAENYIQKHTGRDQAFATSGVGNNLDNDEVLNSFDLFPSVNLVQNLKEDQNIRLSYSKTIARPSFKELSYAQILDPITDRIFNGSLFVYDGAWDGQLVETRINNFDLRWEIFGKSAQTISVSAFYKTFDKPIELVRIPQAQTSNEFQPRNVGDGSVLGAEIEFAKKLGFLGAGLEKLSFNGNITVVQSAIDMTDTEFNSRRNFEKQGQTIDRTRQMAGQAPYIVNAGLGYADPEKGLDFGLFYNVKGRTLTVVGGGLFPDVFSVPFHSLNFNLNKNFGKFGINLSASNILGDRREEVFEAFNASDEIFSAFTPGSAFGVGIKYSFY